jgi:hypothetical protein
MYRRGRQEAVVKALVRHGADPVAALAEVLGCRRRIFRWGTAPSGGACLLGRTLLFVLDRPVTRPYPL